MAVLPRLIIIIGVAILCLHMLQLSNALKERQSFNKTSTDIGLNKTGVLLNSSTKEHLRMIRSSGNCYVDLYQHTHYSGNRLRVYGEIYNLANNGFNDRASSAKVFGPCQWIFYVSNFDGDPSVLTAGSYRSSFEWGQADNALSSLRCMPPDGTKAIVLFQHSGFRGQMRVLYGSDYELRNSGFRDKASSAIVTGGIWRLYEHANYHGHSATAYTGHHIGIPIGNDRLSSVKLIN